MIFQDFWNNCVVMRKKIVIFFIADIIGPDNSNVVCCLPWNLKWSESPSVVSDSSWPVDCTVHGIPQARILEWVAVPSPRGSSQPRDRTQVSHIAGRFFTRWAIIEALKFEGHAKFQLEISGGKKKNQKRPSVVVDPFYSNHGCNIEEWWMHPEWKTSVSRCE